MFSLAYFYLQCNGKAHLWIISSIGSSCDSIVPAHVYMYPYGGYLGMLDSYSLCWIIYLWLQISLGLDFLPVMEGGMRIACFPCMGKIIINNNQTERERMFLHMNPGNKSLLTVHRRVVGPGVFHLCFAWHFWARGSLLSNCKCHQLAGVGCAAALFLPKSHALLRMLIYLFIFKCQSHQKEVLFYCSEFSFRNCSLFL